MDKFTRWFVLFV